MRIRYNQKKAFNRIINQESRKEIDGIFSSQIKLSRSLSQDRIETMGKRLGMNI